MFCLTFFRLSLPDKRYVYALIFHSPTCLEIYYLNFCFSPTILCIPRRGKPSILHDYHLPLETLNLPISFSILNSELFYILCFFWHCNKTLPATELTSFLPFQRKTFDISSPGGIWVERVSNKNWNKISLSWNYFLSQVFCKWKHFWLYNCKQFLLI